jgi:hypothetical protein
MFKSDGQRLIPAELERIVALLRQSDLTLFEIAAETCCSPGVIGAVNRKWQIRKHAGLEVSNPQHLKRV